MSAKLLTTDNHVREIAPANGRFFTLPELTQLIGCQYIEVIYAPGRSQAVMVIDEVGKLEGKPFNELATAAWTHDPIMGNAVLCTMDQLRDDEERALAQEVTRSRLVFYVITRKPSDIDAPFVVRAQWPDEFSPWGDGIMRSPLARSARTLDEARLFVPPTADMRIAPMPGEDPVIVETWMGVESAAP